jgi:hypothetical protein
MVADMVKHDLAAVVVNTMTDLEVVGRCGP